MVLTTHSFMQNIHSILPELCFVWFLNHIGHPIRSATASEPRLELIPRLPGIAAIPQASFTLRSGSGSHTPRTERRLEQFRQITIRSTAYDGQKPELVNHTCIPKPGGQYRPTYYILFRASPVPYLHFQNVTTPGTRFMYAGTCSRH